MIWTQQPSPPPTPPGLAEAVAQAIKGQRANTIRYPKEDIDTRAKVLGWITWHFCRAADWRSRAMQICREAGSRRPEEHLRAIYAWVKANVSYHREPGEIFQLPGFTWRNRAGDCDDHTILMLVLAGSIGIDGSARFVWVPRPEDGQMTPVHVFPIFRIGDRMIPADTTSGVPFGVDPEPSMHKLAVQGMTY